MNSFIVIPIRILLFLNPEKPTIMDKKRPNPRTVNPYDSKGYKRTIGIPSLPRPNPNTVNPYSAKPKSISGK